MKTILILALLLVGWSAQAATLKKHYRDENNDLICVYKSHFKRVTINAGFNGHCSFNVPDKDL